MIMYRATLYKIGSNEDKWIAQIVAPREWAMPYMYGYLHCKENTDNMTIRSVSETVISVTINDNSYEIRLETI